MNAAADLLTSQALVAAVPEAAALDEKTVATALQTAHASGERPFTVLARTSGLGGDAYAQALARTFDYRFMPGHEVAQLDPDFALLAPAEATRRHCVVVHDGEQLLAVFADPFDASLRAWLELRVSQPLDWVLAPQEQLEALIARRAEALRAIDAVLPAAAAAEASEGGVDNLSYVRISEDTSPVVRLVHSTVYDALRAGASDVHLESTATGLVVRYRLDGVLAAIATVPGVELAEQVISRIKVMSDLDIAERRIPQDGRFKIAVDRRPIDFRVSIIPSIFGEDAVLRILDKQALTKQMSGLRLDVLGFEPQIVERLRQLSSLPYGMLLVTGPTGSGKTTTLYAAISETQTGRDKIITIEDPVEYQLPGVLQIPVNEKKGLTFARGLRSILRHDPDKIMVGEIRDPETAQIAIQSALTGHLVFTTVHANNVFDVVSRFVHMGVDTHSFVSALSAVMAQRLVRIVCEQCSEGDMPSRELLESSRIPLMVAAGFKFRRGQGCGHCRGTGYHGRRAVGELLVLNDEMREAIVSRAPVRQLKELAHKAGVRLIRHSALDLVRRGQTTVEEVNRVTIMA
ncbi:MAG: type II/IV secretion system protein [Gammaproteobacteria bacterium]|nr:type II/IV secretion system protein [Gammaproteobacteria bacterium]MBV9697507.1 type II/IV secretion system protein [Gammaproteobacteria bacterium]